MNIFVIETTLKPIQGCASYTIIIILVDYAAVNSNKDSAMQVVQEYAKRETENVMKLLQSYTVFILYLVTGTLAYQNHWVRCKTMFTTHKRVLSSEQCLTGHKRVHGWSQGGCGSG